MDTDTARIVAGSITAVGAVVWLAGLWFLLAPSCRRNVSPPQDIIEGTLLEGKLDGWLSGSDEVEGDPGKLASRAALVLATGHSNGAGQVQILEKDDHHLRFEWMRCGRNQMHAGHGELRFTRLTPGRTLVDWAVQPSSGSGLLWAGGVFLVVGLFALVGGCWAVTTFFALSSEAAVRGQTLQMLQVSHFLWPPFLFGALYRARGRGMAAQLESLIHNLPFLGG
jgi:hypothetical protein